MKAVETPSTNLILTAPVGDEDFVLDLPVTQYEMETPNGVMDCIMSCWELSPDELKRIQETGKIYFHMYGKTHPPMLLTLDTLEEMMSNE